MILQNPQALLFLLALPLFVLLWYWRRGRIPTSALGLRLLALTLIIVALANPMQVQPVVASGTLVLLVDQSDSLGEEGRAELRTRAGEIARSNGGQEGEEQTNLHVIYFGGNTTAPLADHEADSPLQTEQTDIAEALRTARGLIGSGGGRVILVSDGEQTRGDALAEARILAARGIPVDTLAQPLPERPEVWLESVRAPETLREGEEYSIDIVVGSTGTTNGRLSLFDGAAQLATQDVTLSAGDNSFNFSTRAGTPGIARLRATISSPDDTFDRNNSAATTALIAPPPRVLLVEGQNGGTAPLRVALRDANIETEVLQASLVPAQLSQLDRFEGIVLVDVSASEMTLDQMTTLREFVRSEGRGLVATGGRSSFTLGAYKDTPLEEVLPVEMTPPPRPERADVALLLIIDRSASMGGALGVSKFDMAKEASILATETLRDGDRLGVLAFDTFQDWAVEFQQVNTGLSLGQIQERIGQISLGGGTDILGALDVGLNVLDDQPSSVRHAVLLTDGRSFTNARGPYQALLEQARAQNITLSTIAIGRDADTELCQDLALWGAGRYYYAAEPIDIPRLTLLESEIAASEPQIEGDFRANLSAPHPLLRNFATNEIPGLNGYVGTSLKPEAELVLESPEQDPVLAVWQYGLGRAVAWTPSIEAPWANSWANWPEYGQFWGQLIRYTLPEPDGGPLQVRATPRGDEVIISADSLAPGGTTVDLADTVAEVTLPDGTSRVLPLRQVGPGSYAESVALPADGAYSITVRQRKDTLDRVASIGFVQHYPAEFLPRGDGAALLERISTLTGGEVLTSLEGIAPSGTQPGEEATGLWFWLLLGAALLWPVEIAIRRGWLRV